MSGEYTVSPGSIFEFAQVFLNEGEIFLEGLFELSFDQLPHGVAFKEDGVLKMVVQFRLELEQFFRGGNAVFCHNVQ
jgi:hypothetical protein